MKWTPLLVVLPIQSVNRDVLPQQLSYNIATPITVLVRSQVMQHIPSSVIFLVHIRTIPQQLMHYMKVILPGSSHKRRPPLLIPRIHVASKLQQQLYNPDMVFLDGLEQGRYPASRRTIGLRTDLQQVFGDVDVTALGCTHQAYAQEVVNGLRLRLRLLDDGDRVVVFLVFDRFEETRFDARVLRRVGAVAGS
jgi:hypothetical protein